MGILGSLFRTRTNTGTFFNHAIEHWKAHQGHVTSGDAAGQAQELLEVIRLCQLALEAQSKNGDAYVLLANAFTVSSTRVEVQPEAQTILAQYAIGTFFEWESKPYWTRNKSAAQQVREMVYRRAEQITSDAYEEIGRQFGREAISPSTYPRIENLVHSTVRRA